jgi:glutaredoxin 3
MCGGKMKKVIVYSSDSCPYCIMAKDFFKENNIKFEEKDVSADQVAADEMVEKSGQRGIPVIDIEGEIIVGFNVPAIKKALEIDL